MIRDRSSVRTVDISIDVSLLGNRRFPKLDGDGDAVPWCRSGSLLVRHCPVEEHQKSEMADAEYRYGNLTLMTRRSQWPLGADLRGSWSDGGLFGSLASPCSTFPSQS